MGKPNQEGSESSPEWPQFLRQSEAKTGGSALQETSMGTKR